MSKVKLSKRIALLFQGIEIEDVFLVEKVEGSLPYHINRKQVVVAATEEFRPPTPKLHTQIERLRDADVKNFYIHSDLAGIDDAVVARAKASKSKGKKTK